MNSATESPERESELVAPGGWPMIAVLTSCYLVSTLDRYVVNLLIQPIANSLHLTDIQISLMVGLAFTIFYSTVGLLLGRLVDRHDRRVIIVAGILIWTAATAATGLAWSYYSLLIPRVVVGIGEAALAPAAYSLIAEVFPKTKLSRATTIYFLGGAVGPGVSLILAAFALRWAEGLNERHLLNALHGEPWRLVLLLAAVPGLAAATAVALTVRDPRTARSKLAATRSNDTLWGELASKPFLYVGLITGTAAVAVYINGLAAWWPTHALRDFGWPLANSGVYFGIALAAGAVSGILASGTLGTALVRRFGDAGNGIALTSLSILAAPILTVAPLLANPVWQLIGVAFALAYAFAINGLAPVGFQLVATPAVRGRISALYVATSTIIGAGFGPVAVAALGGVRIGTHTLGLAGALSISGLVCGILMIAAYGLYWRSIRARAQAVNDAPV